MTAETDKNVAIPELMDGMGRAARCAARLLALSSNAARNQALLAAAAAVRSNAERILLANAADLEAATQRELGAAMLDRLLLDAARVESIAVGLEAIAE